MKPVRFLFSKQKTQMSEKILTLSIETAIQGGSIAILQNAVKLDGWVGTKEISKSEDILDVIKKLLLRNGLEKERLGKIIVSVGPGSYTGVRIGMAIGLGLKKAFESELIGVYVLEAMFSVFRNGTFENDEIISAVPFGRNQVCSQKFTLDIQKFAFEKPNPQLSTIEEFLTFNCNTHSKKIFIFQSNLFLDVKLNYREKIPENIFLIDAGENLALVNAWLGIQQTKIDSKLKLIYAKESVFGK